MASRRLDLHVSALNDEEFKLYTASLLDITLEEGTSHDDAYLESLSLSVREARAWLRGRYSHIPAATLDNILRFFSPNLSQTDMLSGGQFFAALRMVVHAESGKEVDRSLAFVQAHPSSHPVSRPGSPPKQRNASDSSNPFYPPRSNNNPFSSAQSTSAKSHDGSSDSAPLKLPPLPPRKPSFQPPPRHGSLINSIGGNIPPPPPPKPALSHSHPHMTSTLMKQSLIASKTGKTMKQAEEQLEKERVLKVLKSSENSSSSSSSPFANRGRSSSPNKISPSASTSESETSRDRAPPLPSRRNKPPSPPMSTSSFQQIALAGTSTPTSHNPFTNNIPRSPFDPPHFVRSPSTSPARKSTDLPPLPSGPPPKHPDQSHSQNLSNLAYRKPPPPIPPTLSSSSSFAISGSGGGMHKRTPSFSRLRSDSNEPNDADKKGFEAVYGSAAKSASPYVSSFSKDSTPTRPLPNPTSTDYFNNNGNMNGNYSENNNGPSSGRMFRSKSLHHPSSPSLASRLAAADLGLDDGVERSPFSPLDDDNTPLASPGPSPNTRRKRPESVQVFGSKAGGLGNWNSPKGPSVGLGGVSPSNSSTNLNRHMSLSTPSPPNAAMALRRQQHQRKSSNSNLGSSSTSDSPFKSLAASIQPQLSSMQQQLQPHLDKARYKAEAGLSKRGFIAKDHPKSMMRSRREDQEGLMRDGSREWEGENDGVEDELESDEDEEEYRQGDRNGRMPISMSTGGIGSRDYSVSHAKPELLEKDHLKWPVADGEGWRPL